MSLLEFTHFLSAEMRRTRMDKGRRAFFRVVFGVSRPNRQSFEQVEQFSESHADIALSAFSVAKAMSFSSP